jgi:hypothetical protein
LLTPPFPLQLISITTWILIKTITILENTIVLDLIRGAHLVFLALGMGPALYFDLRSLLRIKQPLAQTDINELHRIHTVVTLACVGLWLTGVTLVWWRTNFDLAVFSPKLWAKLGVVTLLSVNAMVLNIFVIPTLTRYIGDRLVDIPLRTLMPMALCAGISLSCWLAALALGSSFFLKTAPWIILTPILAGLAASCIGGVMAATLALRLTIRRRSSAYNHSENAQPLRNIDVTVSLPALVCGTHFAERF